MLNSRAMSNKVIIAAFLAGVLLTLLASNYRSPEQPYDPDPIYGP